MSSNLSIRFIHPDANGRGREPLKGARPRVQAITKSACYQNRALSRSLVSAPNE
jgi:hypothetical protein